MKKRLYSIRDNKAGFFSPREDINNDTAIRNFSYAIKNNELLMSNKSDYDLYFVGTFDEESAVLEAVTPPVFLVSGGSLINEKS